MKTREKRRRYRRWVPTLIAVLAIVAVIPGIFKLGVTVYKSVSRQEAEDTSWKEACPEELLILYEKNPDARSFVKHYTEKKGRIFPIDLSEYQDCDTVPLLMQWDERWGYANYAGSLFGLSGCGPTCLSMVAIYLKGDTTMDPLWMLRFSTEHGFSCEEGTAWSFMADGAAQLGLEAVELPLQEDRVVANLEAGNPIICIMGPGDFTTTGHFIVLTGYHDGKITVNDPNSYANSEKTWTYAQLEGQIQNLWAYR